LALSVGVALSVGAGAVASSEPAGLGISSIRTRGASRSGSG
jgi:hypothetical protein